jgi:hypothetical protein
MKRESSIDEPKALRDTDGDSRQLRNADQGTSVAGTARGQAPGAIEDRLCPR